MTKILIVNILAAALLLAGCKQGVDEKETTQATTQPTPTQSVTFEAFTKDELMADYTQMKTCIESYHPKLYTDADELEAMFEQIENGITEGMTKLEFMRLLAPLNAVLNCGHTGIHYGDGLGDIMRLPVIMAIAQDKLYIIDNTFYAEAPIGTQVVSINGRTAQEIIEQMKNCAATDGDNETAKYSRINSNFSMWYLLNIEYNENFVITYLDADGKENTAQVAALMVEEIFENAAIYDEEWVHYQSVFEDDYAIIEFNSFFPFRGESITSYNEFTDEFFLEVKEKNIQNVILDVRENGGGDPKVTSHLFSYLETQPQPYWNEDMPDYYPGLKDSIPMAENNFDGNLYILIDGGCRSSTGHLLALLKYQNAGVFIGEESGASFACSDSSRSRDLDITGLEFRYSTQVWQVATEGLTPGRGIMPDFQVVPTIDDYLEDRDAVLEYAIGLLR